jgi:hypothetical protein
MKKEQIMRYRYVLFFILILVPPLITPFIFDFSSGKIFIIISTFIICLSIVLGVKILFSENEIKK